MKFTQQALGLGPINTKEQRLVELDPDCPAWFRPANAKPAQCVNVMRGLHPTGRALCDEAWKKCGGCHHFRPAESRCRYGKDVTGVHGPEAKASWRACSLILEA